MNSRPLIFGLIAIAVIWTVVAGVVKLTQAHTSTPEKVAALMENAPWENVDDGDIATREKHLKDIVAQVNMLDFEQRRLLRENYDEANQQFFNSLTSEEKSFFLESTVEEHFKSIMKAFNQMTAKERARIVDRARADLRRNDVDGQNMERLKAEDEKVFQNLVEKGLGAYYEEANAETKLDLAPLLEEMQQRLRALPGRAF
ncbi:hypothetical protein FEM03_04495 [Phragmitibacter flavus]|uniref:Uncharacterized protein n=1 Tax=Phragmitibacter flavus TaxID=2576071 RepID=A0A5R8KI51_9BACT|nr:hypothetical protein [Phragmitibacter flavus]TLD71988.1 hypothetical protein FEM03_04495 [Phragmitibacter flavus]